MKKVKKEEGRSECIFIAKIHAYLRTPVLLNSLKDESLFISAVHKILCFLIYPGW
jgi:hypothetical protein